MLRRASKRGAGVTVNASTKDSDRPKRTKNSRNILGVKAKGSAEMELEKLVFGGESEMLQELEKRTYKKQNEKREDAVKKPAWEDDDDNEAYTVKVKDKHAALQRLGKKMSGQKYTQQLRNEFEKLAGTPSWATLKSDRKNEGDDEDDELLRQTGDRLESSRSLPATVIEVNKCTDINKLSVTKGKLRSVEFHPSSQVALTAGMDHRLNLFQVDGANNPKIQSIFMDNFPIFCARFNREGEEVVMASRHKSFYFYDMITGKIVNIPPIKGLGENCLQRFEVSPDGQFIVFYGSYGNMHLVSAKSKEWITTYKMNGSVQSMAFSQDGKKMYSHGDDSEVYIWDMSTRDCIHRFTDDGCLKGTSVTVSHNGRYLACGSYSGVVNIYDTSTLTVRAPKPLKSLMNLTTPCTAAKFNSTSEILAIASDYAERAVKLVHFPSMTVFANFPDKTDNLRIPLCLDFSLNSGYFSIGNNKGQALLYRLKHYGNY